MNFLHKLLLLFLLSLFAFQTNGQVCSNYHIDNCGWADKSFFYSRQSRSALFSHGITSKFVIIVYANEEYFVSIAGHKKLGDIKIRVYEDDNKKTELYDNSKYNYEKYFYFQNKNTRKLVIEVTSEKKANIKNPNEKYCLGVLIEFRHMKSANKNNSSKDIGF